MALFAPVCPHCGAPAPSVEALRAGFRCSYCDRVVEASRPEPEPSPPPQAPPPSPSPAIAARAPQPSPAPVHVRTPPPKARSSSVSLGFGSLLGLLVLFLCISPKTCGSTILSDESSATVAALEKCPRAKQLLGEGIAVSWVGCATGESKSGCDTGSGSWSIPVSGSKARGSANISVSKHKKGWRLDACTLEVGDVRVDVVACQDVFPNPDD
jgi:hypothetical protein